MHKFVFGVSKITGDKKAIKVAYQQAVKRGLIEEGETGKEKKKEEMNGSKQLQKNLLN
jgi:hypothetical protein